MKVLSARITAYLIKQAVIAPQEQQVYEYGFELILSDVLNFSVMLTLGAIAEQLWYSVLYLLIFVGLRSFCGGYHAKTHVRCHCATIGAFVLFLVLNALLIVSRQNAVFVLCGDFAAFIPVILLAPITHANKPLSPRIRKKNRRLAIALYGVLTVVAAILLWQIRQEGIAISLTLWIVSLCMIPAINNHPQKGGNHYEEGNHSTL